MFACKLGWVVSKWSIYRSAPTFTNTNAHLSRIYTQHGGRSAHFLSLSCLSSTDLTSPRSRNCKTTVKISIHHAWTSALAGKLCLKKFSFLYTDIVVHLYMFALLKYATKLLALIDLTFKSQFISLLIFTNQMIFCAVSMNYPCQLVKEFFNFIFYNLRFLKSLYLHTLWHAIHIVHSNVCFCLRRDLNQNYA